ncbi:MAG: hypothetical protein QM790_04515 [Nibricoccus sp.]
MKKISLFLLLVGALAFVGCETVRNDMKQRFTPPQYQPKVVDVDQRKAYEIARAVLKRMDYQFERGGPAQGLIHAVGPLDASVAGGPGTARQIWFDAKFTAIPEGGTRIEVLFSRMVEDDFNKRPGQGSVVPLRDSPLYEVFFGYVDEMLKAGR